MQLYKILRSPDADPAQGAIDSSTSDSQKAAAPTPKDYGPDVQAIRSEAAELRKWKDDVSKDPSLLFANREKKDSSKLPARADYPNTPEGIEQWIDARSKFLSRNEFNELMTEREAKDKTQKDQISFQSAVQSHFKRQVDARSRYADFDQVVVNAPVQLPAAVQRLIVDSEQSADLEYHLCKNPADAYKLLMAFQQGERQGMREIDRLEFKFENDAQARKAADKQTRFGETSSPDGGAGFSKSDEAENLDIAQSYYGTKKRK